MKKKYIVTGVSGQLGGRVASIMLNEADPHELIFTVPFMDHFDQQRKEAWEKAGVTVLEANYDNYEQLLDVFKQGERVFFVSSIINGPKRVAQHKNVIDAAKEAGIEHITYTSFFGANREGYHQYVLEDHRPTEKMLRESGISYNIMRDNLYMENYVTVSVILANCSNYIWGTNAGEGKATFIAKDDCARCGAALLLGRGEPNQDYDITSLTPISERDICEKIAKVSGLPYKYVPMSDEEFQKYLMDMHIPETTDGDLSQSPVPFCTNDMVTNEKGIANSQMGVVSHDVEKLTGHKPLTIDDLIEEYKYVWQEKLTSIYQLHRGGEHNLKL